MLHTGPIFFIELAWHVAYIYAASGALICNPALNTRHMRVESNLIGPLVLLNSWQEIMPGSARVQIKLAHACSKKIVGAIVLSSAL